MILLSVYNASSRDSRRKIDRMVHVVDDVISLKKVQHFIAFYFR